MTSLHNVNPAVRHITASPFIALQSSAAHITSQISQGVQKPFEEVIDVSSGDPHKAGIKPLSFVRQVLAVCLYPELVHNESFPLDVRLRAQKLLNACEGGSVGSYCPKGSGLSDVQDSIAKFIARRDGGVPSCPENIILTPGSQKALMFVVKLLVSGEAKTQVGVLTPLPCPHTLPILLEEAGVRLVPYKLREDMGWSVDLEEVHQALQTARVCCWPRALYISNPGNPTGHVQDRLLIEQVIKLAAAEGLFLLVDEVYQDSVHGQGRPFVSFKRVLSEMGPQYSNAVELASFHSLSNGIMGECGLRGGYVELVNTDPGVMTVLRNIQNSSSPPVLPQLGLELMVNPPRPEDPSYFKYRHEVLDIQATLTQNAQRAWEFLNGLPGVSCQPGMGGIFIYPRLNIPPEMVEQAKVSGVEADVLYCQRLLEEEGVCVGAGCENGRAEGNYHLRLCVLVPPATLEGVLARLRSFHLRLLDRISNGQ